MFASSGQFAEPPYISPSTVNSNEVQRYFQWRRIYKGVFFQRQGATISVNTRSGELASAGLTDWGELPTNEIGRVSEARAQELALQAVREKFKGMTSRVVRLERKIVEKNRYWIDGSDKPIPRNHRFAWLVILFLPEKRDSEIFVGVDSQTEEIIFGEAITVRGRG
ncbi:MAG: hypothetical protein QM758_08295 [Armatimonas sp.]